MSTSEDAAPKKKLKEWQIVAITVVALFAVGAIFGGSSSTSTQTPAAKRTPTPTRMQTPKQIPTPTPEVSLSYSGEITRWEPINPASGRAVFTIRNTGETSFIPQSCTVSVKDESSNYSGYDIVSGFGEIKPDAKFMGNVILTVTNKGSSFVTKGAVECDLKAVP